ncbi:Arsenate reductase [Operophtera brumata]|uniref:Arsenate reductase n=1 Tax=Operophtera brumata TaxID=104452 RepID=A0A0L7LUX8_OPEBR|nr:Arsenate reductase [Operophtera brumata]
MDSVAPSDSESNVSGFMGYSDKNCKTLYSSLIQNMTLINQDILQIEKNLTNIVAQSGPLEGQLSLLLQKMPKPGVNVPMETE